MSTQLEKMKMHPDEYFKSPQEVLKLDVNDDDKKAILTNWFDALDHICESNQEGLAGENDSEVSISVKLQEIKSALNLL